MWNADTSAFVHAAALAVNAHIQSKKIFHVAIFRMFHATFCPKSIAAPNSLKSFVRRGKGLLKMKAL
jgi:hypothetical protein